MKSDPLFQESSSRSTRRLSHLTRNQQAVLNVLHEQPNALSAQAVYRVHPRSPTQESIGIHLHQPVPLESYPVAQCAAFPR